MIREIDEALLDTLRKAEVLPGEKITVGLAGAPEDRSLALAGIGLVVEEQGIGNSRTIKKEQVADTFDCDGSGKEFALSQAPVKPLLSVESPPGSPRNEPADYTADYVKGTVTFRAPPERAKDGLIVRYNIARATGEVILLKLKLEYAFYATASDAPERNRIVLATIDTLYREKEALIKAGIEELRIRKACQLQDREGRYTDTSVLECDAWTTRRIELPPGTAMGKIEVSQSKK